MRVADGVRVGDGRVAHIASRRRRKRRQNKNVKTTTTTTLVSLKVSGRSDSTTRVAQTTFISRRF